jgi:hypothetical protein
VCLVLFIIHLPPPSLSLRGTAHRRWIDLRGSGQQSQLTYNSLVLRRSKIDTCLFNDEPPNDQTLPTIQSWLDSALRSYIPKVLTEKLVNHLTMTSIIYFASRTVNSLNYKCQNPQSIESSSRLICVNICELDSGATWRFCV